MQDKRQLTPPFLGHFEYHGQTQPFSDWRDLSKSLILSSIHDSDPNIMLSAAIYNKFGRHTGRASGNALLVSLLSLE
jgi:hypothetical protein